jgi:hypothetical protein
LLGKPKYGGGVNEAVLIQEYADGPEYAGNSSIMMRKSIMMMIRTMQTMLMMIIWMIS